MQAQAWHCQGTDYKADLQIPGDYAAGTGISDLSRKVHLHEKVSEGFRKIENFIRRKISD